MMQFGLCIIQPQALLHHPSAPCYITQCQCVLKALFLAKVTFNQADADVLKLTQLMVHTLLHPSTFVW